MKISIVIPTYNQGLFIKECLQSIRDQTFSDWEAIIQDSESADNTRQICEEYTNADSRFIYYREKDCGQSDAINRGLHRSSGDLWTWICSDDFYYSPHALDSLVNAFNVQKLNEKIAGAYGNAVYVDESGKKLGAYYCIQRDIMRKDFQLLWPLSQPASIWRTNLVKNVGGVDQELHLGMDLDLFIKILGEDKILHYTNATIASIRIQDESKSVKLSKQTAVNTLQIVKKYFGSLGKTPEESAYFHEFRRHGTVEEVKELLKREYPHITISQKIRVRFSGSKLIGRDSRIFFLIKPIAKKILGLLGFSRYTRRRT